MTDNEQKLSEVIKELIHAYKLSEKLNEVKLREWWSANAGASIIKHTKGLYLKNKVLYVRIDAPALKNELIFLKSSIIDKINKASGEKSVEDIVLF